MAYRSFEELDVWKRASKIAVDVYKIMKNCRDFGIRDQMQRAAVSIASNIAEGAERNSNADFIRFIHIAKGSAAELRTQFYIAHEIGLIDKERKDEMVAELKELSSMLQALAKSLKT